MLEIRVSEGLLASQALLATLAIWARLVIPDLLEQLESLVLKGCLALLALLVRLVSLAFLVQSVL